MNDCGSNEIGRGGEIRQRRNENQRQSDDAATASNQARGDQLVRTRFDERVPAGVKHGAQIGRAHV